MGTIKKIRDNTTRYVVVPSFTILAVIKPEEFATITGSRAHDAPDKLVNIGTVFERKDIYKCAEAHRVYQNSALITPMQLTSESIKFCSHDKLPELFKDIQVFDARPKVVSIEVANAIRK